MKKENKLKQIIKGKNILLFLLLSMTLSCCSNDDDNNTPTNPIDQLPPATQSGEQTFGCLIDGQAFVPPKFGNNAPGAFYQFVDGMYTLSIYGSRDGGTNLKTINIGAIDVPQVTESNYPLVSEESGNFLGKYLIGGGILLRGITANENPGTLTITRFDPVNFIISGTFEFTVLDNDGNEIKITNGRFDMNYTN